jgi:hypothetical protein
VILLASPNRLFQLAKSVLGYELAEDVVLADG